MSLPIRALILLLLLHLGGCLSHRCDQTVCVNDGYCVDGYCSCPTGFEGDRCERTWSDKFAGKWDCDVVRIDTASRADSQRYVLSVRQAPDDRKVLLIDRFEDAADSIVCTISGPRSFQIKNQYTADSFFYLQSGQGTLDSLTGAINGGSVYKLGKSTFRTSWRLTRAR